MMQEYWVNIYDTYIGRNWADKRSCIRVGEHSRLNGYGKLLYRIHVKMKPVIIKNTKEGRRAWEAP